MDGLIRMLIGSRCEKGVHRFEPRYDIVAPEWIKQVKSIKGDIPEAYEQIYVHDICVYCGLVRKREDIK